MFDQKSSSDHPANRNRIDAVVSGAETEPVAVALAESKVFLEQQSEASLEWNPITGTPSCIEGKLSKSMAGLYV